MRVAVYGNLIYDQIITIDRPLVAGQSYDCLHRHYRCGGLANFCRAGHKLFDLQAVSSLGDDEAGQVIRDYFEHLDCKLHAPNSPSPTSTAVVITDGTTRTGCVHWGACRSATKWTPATADWHHFMYLDRLQIPPTTLKNWPGTISVDFCNSDDIMSYTDHLQYVDYLITAERSPRSPLHLGMLGLAIPVRRGMVIHQPEKAWYKIGNEFAEAPFVVQKRLDVTGAGDYFAAHCIANLITQGQPGLVDNYCQTLRHLRQQS